MQSHMSTSLGWGVVKLCSDPPIITSEPILNCDFIYYGQTERSLRTRMAEHRRAICNNQKSSKIAQHANETGHEFDLTTARVVESENNCHQRLFLEAWYSELDNNSGNDNIQIPNIYGRFYV